jgi:hypothetical protein
MKQYKTGDKMWYIPGYRENQLIAILCTIKEVDAISTDEYALYWLDEPIGHAVFGDELLHRDEAVEEILSRYKDEIEDEPDQALILASATLTEFRQESQNCFCYTN